MKRGDSSAGFSGSLVIKVDAWILIGKDRLCHAQCSHKSHCCSLSGWMRFVIAGGTQIDSRLPPPNPKLIATVGQNERSGYGGLLGQVHSFGSWGGGGVGQGAMLMLKLDMNAAAKM